MTYNIQNDYRFFNNGVIKNKVKDITSLIKHYDVDIVAMQELSPHQLGLYKNMLSDYTFIGNHRHSGFLSNEYTGLFIKNELDIKDYNTYSLSDNYLKLGTKLNNHNYPRICTTCHLIINNTKYLVVNTHLDNSSDLNRKEELDVLKKIIQKEKKMENLIVLGDFNMDENKYLKDFSKKLNLKNCTIHLGNTFISKDWILDHIYISKNLKCEYKEKLLVEFSDHYPLVISIDSK